MSENLANSVVKRSNILTLEIYECTNHSLLKELERIAYYDGDVSESSQYPPNSQVYRFKDLEDIFPMILPDPIFTKILVHPKLEDGRIQVSFQYHTEMDYLDTARQELQKIFGEPVSGPVYLNLAMGRQLKDNNSQK